MRVLVACESSGVVRRAFEARGHEAWSADLRPAEDGSRNHFQGDVRRILADGWDLMIAHPPCTYLTSAAAWAFTDGPYHQKVQPGTLVGAARRAAREEAFQFVRQLYYAPIQKIAIENPIGALSSMLRLPDQIVQPWYFGDDASKSTCLWLIGLPLLQHCATDYVRPRMVNGKPRWSNQTDSGQNRLSPGVDRWVKRSQTYKGIAKAADQWGRV